MSQHPGLDLMHVEMGRQCSDALATLDAARPIAEQIAESIRRTKRLVLYAMGGSQHVNRIAEPLYRDLGIDTRAINASEVLMSPLPDGPRTAVIVSQSGESGEIVELLRTPAGQEERFGLTLESGSTLAKNVKAFIAAAGGTEHAFAATRSIILTVAMHGAVLEALGAPQDQLRAALATAPASIEAVDEALAGSDAYIFSGRHSMAGVAESAALSLMELARVPTIGFEGGQFRHGPFEVLRPGLAVLLLRSAACDAPGVAQLAKTSVEGGCNVVLFDASGGTAIDGCTHVELPVGAGLGAAMSMLLALQNFNIAVARRLIPQGIGSPRFTTKVTA